jgi:hypothetical protein
MKRDEYNGFRKNANKRPEDFVDLDEEWEERDIAHCIICYEGREHTWAEHDMSIDYMKKDRRIA